MNRQKYVVLEMPDAIRHQRILEQTFYLEQGMARLLSPFENIETEANQYADHWLAEHEHLFDPETHDPGEFYEAAGDASVDFYLMLESMRMQTRLSLAAGMYHHWEKHAREWLVEQLRGTLDERDIRLVSKANIGEIKQLLACLQIADSHATCLATLALCRLVVNVYKHGEGPACGSLRKHHPSYLQGLLSGLGDPHVWLDDPLGHHHLKIDKIDLQAFSAAIIAFWQGIPPTVTADEIETLPPWLVKASSKAS